jgi:hypothetical protein
MRSLHSALQAQYNAPVQRPVWLVQVDLSSTIYLSSYDSITWNGQTWNPVNIDVASIRVAALVVSGELVLGNADDAGASLVLNETFTDKRIRIWGYDMGVGATPAATVPFLLCDAVGAGAEISPDYVRVGLRDICEYRVGPRATVTSKYGFNTILPAGRTITINGTTFVLQRGR